MKKNKFKHLEEEQRAIIRDMVYSGFSARQIAQELGVEHTTITREVKRNRIVKVPNPRKANPSLYCKKFIKCGIKNVVCQNCTSPHTYCKSCPHVKCYKNCTEFEYIECPKTKVWPYICPNMCFDRNTCRFPKCSYSPLKAHANYTKRLVESRKGINISIEELIEIVSKIKPLIKRGMSPYAALTSIETDINIDVRTIYRYLELGIIDIPAIELPRKVRYKKRKNYKPAIKDKVNRESHEYKNYLKLSKKEKENTFQIDSVIGFRQNNKRIITLHNPKRKFQFMFLVKNGTPYEIVKLFDYLEKLLGSRSMFKKIFGVILADRGREFNLFKQMEMSCLEKGKKRCRVYFCDPNQPNQKGSAEKNHEHIRCILPKKHSNFDLLSNFDVAELTSQVNSYPRKSLNGNTPITQIKDLVPNELLEALGIRELHPNEVCLKPSLLSHTQC